MTVRFKKYLNVLGIIFMKVNFKQPFISVYYLQVQFLKMYTFKI